MAADREMRASDEDRDGAAELLSEAYAVGRLSREELDERAAAAYQATMWGELRDLVADLPPPQARTGLPGDVVAPPRGPRSANRRLISELAWGFVLPVGAVLAWAFGPVAISAAMMLISVALLLVLLFDP
jgi:Domain of unknown function (DUF1707)